MPETQAKMEPPKGPPPRVVATGFPDDPIQELGERIAALPKESAKKLSQYVDSRLS